MPVSSAFLRAEIKKPRDCVRPGNEERPKTDGTGFFPRVWCSHRQFLGLDPHQGSIKQSMMCGPRMGRLLLSFFQRCIRNVHLSGKGPKAGDWTEDGKDLTPSEIVLSSRPALSWARGRPGTNPKGASGKVPGKGPTERIQGVSGTATGGQRDRSPRKPMGPGKFQAPCASLGQFLRQFSPRGQASVPTTRNRGSGRSPASDFSEDALGKSKWPIRGRFPGDGRRLTALHRLKIPQEVLGLVPHAPMR